MKRLLFALLAACGGSAPPPVQAPPAKPAAPAAPVDVPWDQLTGPIKTVSVKGVDATLASKIDDLLASAVGKDLDRTQLREATTKIFAIGGIGDVTLRGTQDADGIALELDVTMRPTVHTITLSPPGPMPPEMTALAGRPLDPQVLDVLARGLRLAFLDKGYIDAAVHWSTKPSGNEVDVVVDVAPGTATVIQKVVFSGNAHAKTADLEKAIAADVVPGTPWSQPHVERALQLITAYYYDRGYINVSIAPPVPSTTATFNVTEGDQFRIGKLSIKDASPADEKKWLALLGVKKGDIFKRSAMTDGLQKLKEATRAVDITPITNLDAKKKTIDVVFELQKSVSPSSK